MSMMSDEWAIVDGHSTEGFESAAGFSVVAYRPKSRGKHCAGANNTCKGFRTKDSEFCAGHQRALAKAKTK